MQILAMIGITFLLLIVSTFSLVGSAYYSDKKYKLGKFLWRFAVITGILYNLSAIAIFGMGIYKLIEVIF